MTTDRAIDIIRRRILAELTSQRITLSTVIADTPNLTDRERDKIRLINALLYHALRKTQELVELHEELNRPHNEL